MRQVYRYILNSMVKPDSHVCDYRLIGSNQLGEGDGRNAAAIRVHIPDDMKLEKLSCDNYSTTEDERTIEELGYDIVVRINGHFFVRNDLKQYEFHNLSSILAQNEGLYLTKEGYLDKEHYRDYLKRIDEENEVKEQEAERIVDELNNQKCNVDDLEYISKDVLLKVLKFYVKESRKRFKN